MNYTLKSFLLTPMNILYSISPKKEIELMFRLKQGYKLNLKDPTTYNEKINWIKLNYDNDDMSACSDKFLVRSFLENRDCAYILNDLLWEGYEPEQIPWDTLPDKFVIKVTHGSGFNIICKDKDSLDRRETVKKLKKWLKVKYLKCYGESWYGKHKPRVIVEKYLENDDGKPLFDYKFFCFDGVPRYVYVDTWKNGEHHINMYDIDFNLLENVSLGYPLDLDTSIQKPDNYEEMIEISKKLSKGFPHVRVDLYSVNGKTFFGEMTFSKGAGFDKIKPYEFDLEMGNHFKLPTE